MARPYIVVTESHPERREILERLSLQPFEFRRWWDDKRSPDYRGKSNEEILEMMPPQTRFGCEAYLIDGGGSHCYRSGEGVDYVFPVKERRPFKRTLSYRLKKWFQWKLTQLHTWTWDRLLVRARLVIDGKPVDLVLGPLTNKTARLSEREMKIASRFFEAGARQALKIKTGSACCLDEGRIYRGEAIANG